MSGPDELRSWAEAHGLKPQTVDKLVSEDVDTIESLKVIDKENVKELGLSFGQRHQLLKAVEDLTRKSQQTGTGGKDGANVGPSMSRQGGSRTTSGHESTQHVSTHGTAECDKWQPPFTFNAKTHGANIIIEYGNTVARSRNSESDGIIFSDRPIAVKERVNLSIVFARKKHVEGNKTMSVGFTSHDPNTIGKKNLPSHCHPTLSQKSGFWLNPIPAKFVRQGNVVSFWATPNGHVLYAMNGEQKGLLFSGVDTRSTLWATIEVHGRALGVQIVGEETVFITRYQCFERYDRVIIRTELAVSKLIMNDEGIRIVSGQTGKETWQEFSNCGAEVLVDDVDDDGHVRIRLERKIRGSRGQAIECIDGVGFPKSIVSRIEPEDDIRVGDIVRVVNNFGCGLVEMSPNAIIDVGPLSLTMARVGDLGVVVKPVLFQESSVVVRVGQHDMIFKRSNLVVAEKRGSTLRGPFGGLCQGGLHFFDKDVSRICVDCRKCTEDGENCLMKMQMTDSPGRVCGCKEGRSGCIACGRCKSCAEKTGNTSSTNEATTRGMMNSLLEMFSVFTEFRTSDSANQGRKSHGLAVGDHVKVIVTDEELQRLQVQHGGYVPDMQKSIGKVGRVNNLVTTNHDMVVVAFSDGLQWCLNPKAVEKVNRGGKVFKEGDTVRFCDDVEKLKKLQEGRGGWNDIMNLVAGKTGTVKKVLIDSDLMISAMGTSCRWNPSAVELSEDLKIPEKVTDRHGMAITVNDVVKIDVDSDILEGLQHYPKGYLDSLREERNTPGVIHEIDCDGDLLVYYSNGKRLFLKAELVSKEVELDASEVDTTAVIEVDDLVLIDSDCEKVEAVQTENKMWHPKMRNAAGKLGQVRALRPTGAVRIDVGGKTWSFATSLLMKADRSEMTRTTEGITASATDAGAENVQVYAAFARGDRVQIGVDPQTLKNLQEGHGGYDTEMEKSIGSNGSVMYINDDGDTWANFPSYAAVFNTKALVNTPVPGPDEDGDMMSVGDFVKICENRNEVEARQEDHGGWNDDMEMALGKIGRIDDIHSDGDIVVKAVGRKWVFHPKSLDHVNVQGDGQLPWNQAHICAPGRHKWKTGKCMVCVECEQCTDYGSRSPNNSNPLKRPGSVCDCGGSDVGCVDCGKCRSCANEPPDRGDPEVDIEVAAKIKNMRDKFDHLHDIFRDVTTSLTTDDTAEEQLGFGKGDVVRVKVTKEELEKLQTMEHGGYNSRKGEKVGETGRVVGFLTGSAIVAFPNEMHCLNPAALEKYTEKEGTVFTKGDFVRICKDIDKLKQLQALPGRGGFSRNMEALVGKTGKVTKVALNGNVHIKMWNRKWSMNPAALAKISDPSKDKADDIDGGETKTRIKSEDIVQVVASEETFKRQQNCHGGFIEEMTWIVGKQGIVREVDLDGDVAVSFADGKRWTLNPLSLTKIDPEVAVPVDVSAELVVGDLVRIDDDEDKAKRLQEGKGNIGWNIIMQNTLGEVGRLLHVSPFNDLCRVRVGGHTWLYRREMLKKVTLEDLELEHSKDDGTMAKKTYRKDLARGDHVKIVETVDTDTLREKQRGHGGYADGMEENRKEIGVVQSIDDDGDIHVLYPRGLRLCFNPEVIEKVDKTEDLFVGDLVQIDDEEDRVKEEQKGHGEWVDDMKSSLGHIGRVVKILPSQDARVKINGRTWTYNSTVLSKIKSPGLAEWGKATICSSGKHDWSSGLCLVCTKCGECTEYGEVCPAKKTRSNDPGSVCGCGKGSAGCDDCGWCKRCAGERKNLPDGDESDSDSDSEIDIGKILSQHRQEIGLAAILQAISPNPGLKRFLDALTDMQQQKDEPSRKGVQIDELPKEVDRGQLFEKEVIPKMKSAIRMLQPKPDTAEISRVLSVLETDVMTPFKVYDRKAERIQLGDTMSSGALDAAKQLTTYLTFLQADTQIDDKSHYACIQVIRNICQQASAISLQFCRQLGKTGMLSTLVSDLALQPGYLPAKVFSYILTSAIAILRSCARVSDNHPYLREAKIEERLTKLLPFKDQAVACSAILILGHIIRGQSDKCPILTDEDTSYLAKCMADSLNAREKDQEEELSPESFLSLDIAMGISALACRDENKKSFLQKGFIPLLMRLITVGNDLEKVHSAKALHALATNENIRQEMRENEDLVRLLEKISSEDEDGEVRAALSGALSMIQYGPEVPYVYDVFVSCSDLDKPWVEQHLKPLLEDDMDLAVCLYYRDFLPGDSIQERVISAIKDSRRIILVVTSHFIKSEWCRNEMKKALDKVVREGDCLIPILLDNCNVPDKLTDIVYLDCSANDGLLDKTMVERLKKKLKPEK